MQTTSALYKSILSDPAHLKEHRAFIGGVEYAHEDILTAVETAATWLEQKPTVTGGLFHGRKVSVGGCVSRQAAIMVLPKGTIPRMAEIRLETRLVLRDLLTGEITSASEWIPKGTFFTDTREADSASGALRLFGYDAMLKAETQYVPENTKSSGWPRKMPAVVTDICYRMGVELDERSVIHDWDMQYPGDFTARECLGYIAACHAGNFTITDAGKLLLVPLAPASDVVDIGNAAMSLNVSPAFEAFSGVQFYYDGKDTYFAGDSSGRVLEIETPWATQEIADAALASLQGYAYQPYEAAGALLDPAAELGDLVAIGGVTGPLAAVSTAFDAMCAADISAPADEEVDHEYPYEDRARRQTRREVANATASLRVDVDEIEGRVEDAEGNYSSIKQTVDNIRLSVSGTLTDGTNSYAEISLHVGDHVSKGYVMVNGNVTVDGSLSADALYAAMGDIADLTVDKLSTSRRIVKYLKEDKTDDNYVRIQDQYIEFISGVYAGGVVQATNPNGGKLYWEYDPDECTIGADGYPYIDGHRSFTTTEKTDWPVYVYTYTELVKRGIGFEKQGDFYVPVDTFGAGDDAGRQKGRLLKDTEGLRLTYHTQDGKTLGLQMGDSGYTDVFGMRKTTGMNFSEWDKEGKFYERVDGDTTRHEYSVMFNAEGDPVQITDSDGHVMELYW